MQKWVAISEFIRNIGLVVGGIIGIYLAWKRVTVANMQAEAQMRQAALVRRDHVAELFNRAVGQLKDDRIEIRLGAIYTLEQICRDFPDLSNPVIQLITAYVREGAREYGDRGPPVDVQEIMRILANVTSS